VTDLERQFDRFLAGDNAAFAELYRELNPRLSAYCYKVSPAGTDDLMQQLWERVIAMRDHGKRAPIASPAAFLFQMLRNLQIDEHRKTKYAVSLEDFPESSAAHLEVSGESEMEAIVLEAFEKLEAEDKEILVLNIYSGYKFGEIAEMLQISNDAAWQRASRARTRLRSLVETDAKKLGISIPKKTRKEKETV